MLKDILEKIEGAVADAVAANYDADSAKHDAEAVRADENAKVEAFRQEAEARIADADAIAVAAARLATDKANTVAQLQSDADQTVLTLLGGAANAIGRVR